MAFLHSYANPEHEQRARDIFAEELPEAYVATSSDVLSEPPEFARTTTTVANAYLGPVLRRYVDSLAIAIA